MADESALVDLPGLEPRGLMRLLPTWDATKHHHITIWAGDLNYRVEATRKMADRLLDLQMHEVGTAVPPQGAVSRHHQRSVAPWHRSFIRMTS